MPYGFNSEEEKVTFLMACLKSALKNGAQINSEDVANTLNKTTDKHDTSKQRATKLLSNVKRELKALDDGAETVANGADDEEKATIEVAAGGKKRKSKAVNEDQVDEVEVSKIKKAKKAKAKEAKSVKVKERDVEDREAEVDESKTSDEFDAI